MSTNTQSLLEHAATIVHTDSIDMLLGNGSILRKNDGEYARYIILDGSRDYYNNTTYTEHSTIPSTLSNFINHWVEFYNFSDPINYVVVCNIDEHVIDYIYIVSDEWEYLVLEGEFAPERSDTITYQWYQPN